MKARTILRMKFAPAVIALVMVGLAAGCGKDEGGGENANQLAAEGWNLFVTGDYSAAIDRFNRAAALDTDLETAWNGLGWSYARLGDLEASRDSFFFVTSTLGVQNNNETNAGLSIVALAIKDYDLASDYAGYLLGDTNYNYEFPYDPSVTDVTLLLIRAIADFNLGDYDGALADVILLGGPSLNPSAPDFVAKLLVAIQDLREQYGEGLLNP